MSKNRLLRERPKIRLMVSVETNSVEAIAKLIRYEHPAKRSRSEFVRLAIEEKLKRDQVC